jgi:hypothetical protein
MFWDKIKNHADANFRRLTGIELKTFKVMVKEVRRHDSKKSRKERKRTEPPLSIERRRSNTDDLNAL